MQTTLEVVRISDQSESPTCRSEAACSGVVGSQPCEDPAVNNEPHETHKVFAVVGSQPCDEDPVVNDGPQGTYEVLIRAHPSTGRTHQVNWLLQCPWMFTYVP
jgi:23S rRNA-/tRNA-specific pseudouridylate synthase